MAERWFLALWPDAQTRAVLAENALGCVPPGARSVHPADLHLTLVFIGELEPERLACVESAASQARAETFTLSMDEIGHFRRARVLWCGSSEAPSALLKLVKDLKAALSNCGIAPERRPYRPHLTLARKVASYAGEGLEQPIQWPVRELVLAFGRDGARPRYQVHRRWQLGDPAANDAILRAVT